MRIDALYRCENQIIEIPNITIVFEVDKILIFIRLTNVQHTFTFVECMSKVCTKKSMSSMSLIFFMHLMSNCRFRFVMYVCMVGLEYVSLFINITGRVVTIFCLKFRMHVWKKKKHLFFL